jgi:hypothetical protein
MKLQLIQTYMVPILFISHSKILGCDSAACHAPGQPQFQIWFKWFKLLQPCKNHIFQTLDPKITNNMSLES